LIVGKEKSYQKNGCEKKCQQTVATPSVRRYAPKTVDFFPQLAMGPARKQSPAYALLGCTVRERKTKLTIQ